MTEPLPWVGPQFDADSLCAEIGGDDWYPEQGGSNAVAKSLCRRCENESACLEWALTHGEAWGIWGATSPNERKKILRDRAVEGRRHGGQLKPIRHGTEAGYKAHQRRGDVVPDSDPCGCRAASTLAAAQRHERKAS